MFSKNIYIYFQLFFDLFQGFLGKLSFVTGSLLMEAVKPTALLPGVETKNAHLKFHFEVWVGRGSL